MNLSALDVGAEIMVVSQFTLYADCRKGRRPGFSEAMDPGEAKSLYDRFSELVAASGLVTRTGVFGAVMDVRFTNRGPVTIILDHDA
jgi:D-tyrosyl-tRNA(Tyr) deacylase